ncbi:GAF domain-containing protein [uncultured Sphingomonas sp.]|uniref:GAF domain-containing protein n=1 Tax=uncultured Sphingomonas sp. TaxID=158754 RepID=UPI0025FCA09E|nr:GAF domain-containing protein [uncultured Sphingomonas sp.]
MVTEAVRLATLKGYDVLDTGAEVEFDALTRRIATTFAVRSAVISFIDEDRQWYKARFGVSAESVQRSQSFCTHFLDSDDVTVVPDARTHAIFRTNPHVLADSGVRFYAAAPIKALNRARLGTVCIFDPAPRRDGLNEREKRQLSSFAAQVVELLEARRNAARARDRAAGVPLRATMPTVS